MNELQGEKMTLPKIEHYLLNSGLTLKEKLEYIQARSLISTCLNAEDDFYIPEEEEAINTINRLNEKIRSNYEI